MSNLTQYKIFIGDDKNNTPFGVAFSFNYGDTYLCFLFLQKMTTS